MLLSLLQALSEKKLWKTCKTQEHLPHLHHERPLQCLPTLGKNHSSKRNLSLPMPVGDVASQLPPPHKRSERQNDTREATGEP